ncbi:MAG: hypothetical protein Q8Q38_01370, partial [bacterium]|nr:hypothetical protein [bacterium]
MIEGRSTVDADFLVTIRNGIASLRVGTRVKGSVREEVLLKELAKLVRPPDSFFPIPQSVRFYEWDGKQAVLVVEMPPQVRQLRWIKDAGPEGLKAVEHMGENAEYEYRSLALPYIILVLPFADGVLQNGLCQAFYRTEPLSGWDDPLLRTNLLNVADGYGFSSWLCMVNYKQKRGASWQEAVEAA